MKKFIIFPLVSTMAFSLFGCDAVSSTAVDSTTDSLESNEEGNTTEEPTTEKPKKEEPTTEALLDDGKMAEYVAAAQKVYDVFKVDFEAYYEFEPQGGLSFCDFDLDGLPELYIMTPNANGYFSGPVYKYENNEFTLVAEVHGYNNIKSYTDSQGGTLLYCTTFGYTGYDSIGNFTFSTDVDILNHYYVSLDASTPNLYMGHSYIPWEGNKVDAARYYNSENILITEEEFNNNINEIIKETPCDKILSLNFHANPPATVFPFFSSFIIPP